MFEINAKLVEVIEKPYNVNGNEGISYKARFLTDKDEMMTLKTSRDINKSIKPLQGKVGKMVVSLNVYKEDVSVKLDSFSAKV